MTYIVNERYNLHILYTTGVSGSILGEILVSTIKILTECGFVSKAVFCDGGTSNLSCLRLLGVTLGYLKLMT